MKKSKFEGSPSLPMISKLFIYLLSNSSSQQLISPPSPCNFLFLLLSRVNWKKTNFSDLNKGSEGSLFFNYIKIIYLFIYLLSNSFAFPSFSAFLALRVLKDLFFNDIEIIYLFIYLFIFEFLRFPLFCVFLLHFWPSTDLLSPSSSL